MEIVFGFFLIALAAVLGGFLSRALKIPSLVGYILVGVVFGALLPTNLKSISSLAEIGTILLLFSVGLELSFDRLSKFLSVGIFGSIIQILLVTLSGYFILHFFGFSFTSSLILSLGFSVSSTAVLVSILSDRGEMETIHGGIMFAWSLAQDLFVIPVIVLLPVFKKSGASFGPIATQLLIALAVMTAAVVAGRLLVPNLIHFVAATNSRELLLLVSVALALGTALAASALGISAALGAFLAGVVISDSQEHHAIFAETRPLRDLFVALFFVTLGFFVTPSIVWAYLPLILILVISIIILKALVVFIVSQFFGFRGRTAVTTSLGLAQVGEFAFVIFTVALSIGLITNLQISLGIAVTLLTLIFSPLIFGFSVPLWRNFRDATSKTPFAKLFTSGEAKIDSIPGFSDHIIICGYGRVGKWVGKALGEFGIPFVVVEYNQKVVNELKEGGISVFYGDPTEPEVLEATGIRNAKAVILAIPDALAAETLIAYIQTVAPNVKIITRAHEDIEWEKLKNLRVDKVVQPEFEAAIEIIRSILIGRGKTKEEIGDAVKSLRVSHSK